MFRIYLTIICMGLISLASVAVQADDTTTTTVVDRKVIVTPAPKATCTSVAGHWEDNIWVDTHEICRYDNRSEGAAWVADYWSCTVAADDGSCTTWVLVPGHWVKTLQ